MANNFTTKDLLLLAIFIWLFILFLGRDKSKSKKNHVEEAYRKHRKKDGQWEFNEKAEIWVNTDQLDSIKAERENEKVKLKWEEVKRQEMAEAAAKERAAELERYQNAVIDEMNEPISLSAEEQELSKQIHIDHEHPTYEEWKAQKLKEKQNKEDHPVS